MFKALYNKQVPLEKTSHKLKMERKNKRNNGRGRKRVPNERPAIKRINKLLGQSLPYENVIVKVDLPVTMLKKPKGPSQGAMLTIRKIADVFNSQAGTSSSSSSTAYFSINSTTTAALVALAFRLDDIADYDKYTSVFDQYRFEKVRLRFRSKNNAIFVANLTSTAQGVPSGYICIDRDDNSAPASVAALSEYDNAVPFQSNQDACVTLVPSVTPPVFAAGTFSGYTTVPCNSVWCDCANADTLHYGVKLAAGTLSGSATVTYITEIDAEYIVSFRNSK